MRPASPVAGNISAGLQAVAATTPGKERGKEGEGEVLLDERPGIQRAPSISSLSLSPAGLINFSPSPAVSTVGSGHDAETKKRRAYTGSRPQLRRRIFEADNFRQSRRERQGQKQRKHDPGSSEHCQDDRENQECLNQSPPNLYQYPPNPSKEDDEWNPPQKRHHHQNHCSRQDIQQRHRHRPATPRWLLSDRPLSLSSCSSSSTLSFSFPFTFSTSASNHRNSSVDSHPNNGLIDNGTPPERQNQQSDRFSLSKPLLGPPPLPQLRTPTTTSESTCTPLLTATPTTAPNSVTPKPNHIGSQRDRQQQQQPKREIQRQQRHSHLHLHLHQNQNQKQHEPTVKPTATASLTGFAPLHRHHSPFIFPTLTPPPPFRPLPPLFSLTACPATSDPSLPTSSSSSSSLALSSPAISPHPVTSTFPSASSSSCSSLSFRSAPLTTASSCSAPSQSTTLTMSRSSRNPPPASGTTRQNEYFVPRDGIDREVISADICRYLGNDALVRPGHYENPQTGQGVQGYYITAYRNLTTAMIEDLKADSARWDAERRAQTSRNTSGVQYRYSETHQSRQHHGPTEPPYQADPYARDTAYDNPRYPGTGAPGYTGAAGSYPPQQAYSTSSGSYGGYPQPQQSPSPADPRYGSTPSSGSVLNQAYQSAQDPYMAMGANLNQRGYAADPYANQRTSAAATQAVYTTAAPTQPGYPATTSPYQYAGQVPPAGTQGYAAMPQDPFYGRAGQSTQQGYAAQGQQYEEAPRTRTSATPTSTQASTSGSSNRRSERESDRHSSDRHHRSSRR